MERNVYPQSVVSSPKWTCSRHDVADKSLTRSITRHYVARQLYLRRLCMLTAYYAAVIIMIICQIAMADHHLALPLRKDIYLIMFKCNETVAVGTFQF